MHFFKILLACQVSLVSGIDIWFNLNHPSCGGGAYVCRDWRANTCCGHPTTSQSITFVGKPRYVAMEMRGYRYSRCETRRRTRTDRSQSSRACLEGGPFTSAGYSISIDRRSVDVSETPDVIVEDCQRVNELVLEDGSRYSLTEFDDSQLIEIADLIVNGTTSENAPEILKGHEILE